MSKENGKDQDDENVDGKPSLGLRVKGATVKEAEDGGAIAVVTVTGAASMELVLLVGEDVQVTTISGRQLGGHVRAVTVKEGKEGGPKVITAKVAGARNLDGLVGLQVRLTPSQGELPLPKGRGARAGAEA